MKTKRLLSVIVIFLFFGMVNFSMAAPTKIGTAQFGGTGPEYNLVWDNQDNVNSIVWLDYTQTYDTWQNQLDWAAGINSNVKINLDAGYSINWTGAWRLPVTIDAPYLWGDDGTTTAGYNITSSEMGHLFYEGLGNNGYHSITGGVQPDWGLLNTGPFNNLVRCDYWSGTELVHPPYEAWIFSFKHGYQDGGWSGAFAAMAVRPGQVNTPLPGAMWLLGPGLLGLVRFRKK